MNRDEIIHLIEGSTAWHLANSYESIPRPIRVAIERMVEKSREDGISPYHYRKLVAEDVMDALENDVPFEGLNCYAHKTQTA